MFAWLLGVNAFYGLSNIAGSKGQVRCYGARKPFQFFGASMRANRRVKMKLGFCIT